MYRRARTLTNISRFFSDMPPLTTPCVAERLENRSIIRVSGTDVMNFLQGLITNDIQHLNNGIGSMYAMFLSTKGRVLCDAIIYRPFDLNTFLIELDVHGIEAMVSHLKRYRVRRKVDIVSLRDEFNIYAVYNLEFAKLFANIDTAKRLPGFIVACSALKLKSPTQTSILFRDLLIYQDPRNVSLGGRVIAPVGVNAEEHMSAAFDNLKLKSNLTYRSFRYELGVGEGIIDLPPGNCFPLEANCDYLHGVSFHKGCYLGQELTARTHHTGVIRKRLMPLYFTKMPSKYPENDTILQEKINLGKLRGIEDNTGLALLRTAPALLFKEIQIGDGTAITRKPSWWPVELPKEKMNIQRAS